MAANFSTATMELLDNGTIPSKFLGKKDFKCIIKRKIIQFKNGQRIGIDISLKKIYKWPIRTCENVLYEWPLGKCKSKSQ